MIDSVHVKDIQNVLDRVKGTIYPSLGDLSGYDVYHHEQSIFSETWKLGLHYGRSTRNVVLKASRRDPAPGCEGKRAVEVEYQILQTLHSRFLGIDCMNVVTPLACLPDDDILLLEHFPGKKLNTVIVDHLRWMPSRGTIKDIEDYFALCGTWLRLFQQFTKKDEHIAFKGSLYLENIEHLLGTVEERGIGRRLQERILTFAGTRCDRIGERLLELRGYHSDFTPWNILASDGHIAVMDFGQFSYGICYDDLTLFLVTLEGYKSVVGISAKNISRMRSAFLEGYGASTIDPDLFDLLFLKNALWVISMMGISTHEKTGLIDRIYRDYRTRKQFGVHLRQLERLTS